MGNFTKAVTDQSFQTDVISSSGAVLVDFWAEWCGPCKAIAPKLEEIATEMQGKVIVAKVNIDENPETPSKMGVRGIPTLVLFKEGKVVDQLVGNHPKERIVEMIQRNL